MEETSGDRLKRARERAGFSVGEACRRFHWTETTYRSHENGQTRVPLEPAEEYAKAYGVTPQWIVWNVGSIENAGIDNLILSKPPESRLSIINAFRAFLGEPPVEAPKAVKPQRPRRGS